MTNELKEIISFLNIWNCPYSKTEDSEELRDAVRILFKSLKSLPDGYFRVTGSYHLQTYNLERYELFYIPDMVNFRYLLKNHLYASFLHEAYDFLWYKILKNGETSAYVVLPANIKNALITTISEGFDGL